MGSVMRKGLLSGLLCLTMISETAHSSEPGKIRVACVGDSITYGAGLENPDRQSYPAVLGRRLGAGYEVRNFGVSGATVLREGDLPYWNQPELAAALTFDPEIVILMLGTNDTKGHNWGRGSGMFADDLAALIARFADLPSKPRIWICLPPPLFGLLRAPVNSTLEGEVLPLISRVAREKNVPVIDINGALAGRGECFPDGVHPDAAGAEAIAGTVFGALQKQVE
jgi:lysophospholipase L1-like esterase